MPGTTDQKQTVLLVTVKAKVGLLIRLKKGSYVLVKFAVLVIWNYAPDLRPNDTVS